MAKKSYLLYPGPKTGTKERIRTKWKNSEDYGKYKTGFIGLQDHASPIWFKNIKIKKL